MRYQAAAFEVTDLLLMTKKFTEEVYSPMFPTLHLEMAVCEAVLNISEASDY